MGVPAVHAYGSLDPSDVLLKKYNQAMEWH